MIERRKHPIATRLVNGERVPAYVMAPQRARQSHFDKIADMMAQVDAIDAEEGLEPESHGFGRGVWIVAFCAVLVASFAVMVG